MLIAGTAGGVAGLSAAGVVGYAWPHSPAEATGHAPPSAAPATPVAAQAPSGQAVHSFASRRDLQPPGLSVSVLDTPAGVPPYIFLANKPYKGPAVGQEGLIIAQRDGDIVWFSPITKGQVLDFNVQSYNGKPVLTWWHGITGSSFGRGNCYIADSSYSLIATVKAGNGLMADMHEFNLTDQGTALVDAYRQHTVDLSPLGGKANGTIVSGVVQEIDIATGDVVFEWDSLGHVPVTETEAGFLGGTPENPFDYFHINSIGTAPDGDLLVSSRNTWTIYKIGRRDGRVRWLGLRLGPRHSPDHILGWRIVGRGPGETVCQLDSGFLTAHNVFRKVDGTFVWSTFVTYKRPMARVIWPPVSLLHRLLVRITLRRAANP